MKVKLQFGLHLTQVILKTLFKNEKTGTNFMACSLDNKIATIKAFAIENIVVG